MGIVYKFFLVLTLGFSAWSRPPVDVTETVVVTEQGPEAKQEAFRKAVETASLKLISETVSPEVMEKQAKRIENVLGKSEKYILFIKGSNPETVVDGSKIKVEMKISLDNLEILLRENGLLQASAHSLKLLPLVEWADDASGAHFAWWVDDPSANGSKLWAKFMTSLAGRLKARNVKVSDNLDITRIPPALRKRALNRDEQLAIAKQFDASLILAGDIHSSPTDAGTKAQFQSELVEVRGAHTLGGNQGSAGPSKEGPENLTGRLAEMVAEQVKGAQASGRMNVAAFKLVVRGKLSFQKLEQLRKELLIQVMDIRALKDRLYAPDEYVFEAESSKTPSELVNLIRKARFSQLKVDALESGGSVMLSVSSM